MNIDAFWEYGDPVASERRFREHLVGALGDDRLELLTQIARSLSLRGRFDEAHRQLDEVEPMLANGGARPRVRYLLERGRTFNSSGEKDRARGFFMDAWDHARAASEDGLAVDAAHMVAITHAGTDEATGWNERGLALAQASSDAKARGLIAAMLNNSAWDLHDLGRFQEALPLFDQARDAWTERGVAKPIAIAKWAVGRCLRSLGRFDEALAIQLALEADGTAVEGNVLEEIAENMAALGRSQDARAYFGRAFEALSADPWIAEHEAARLARLRARAGR